MLVPSQQAATQVGDSEVGDAGSIPASTGSSRRLGSLRCWFHPSKHRLKSVTRKSEMLFHPSKHRVKSETRKAKMLVKSQQAPTQVGDSEVGDAGS